MANENKEIGDVVKKCKILLLDIEGTTTSISFVKDKLFPYAEQNIKQFLETQWESDEVKEVITALRKLALEDEEKSIEGHVTIPGEDASKEDQIEGLVNNVKWQMSSDRKAGPLKQLQGLIWKQGYDKGDIKGHVYDDVSSALEQWHSVDGQKVFIYSSGSVQAQKLLFGQSLAGDLLQYIEDHFDTAVGGKQESASYSAIVEKIGCKADEVLFLTDIVKEAEAARSAGLHVALVSREGNAPLPTEATDSFAVIHSFGQLAASNKRKTDPQNEQPAKVPKTDISNDIKTTLETEAAKQIGIEEKVNELEKMDVEEEPAIEVPSNTANENKVSEVKEVEEETSKAAVDSTTDAHVNTDLPVIDIAEPVVTEDKETQINKPDTDKMETEISKCKDEVVKIPVENEKKEIETPQTEPKTPADVNKVSDESKTDNKTDMPEIPDVPKDHVEENKVKEKTPIVEETPPAIIMEIEEVTEKDNIPDMADIIEDIVPIVEEPNATEDIELQNVGEVLEKECDEILSKVQDVTNLDNIPIKPILNPIIEESMETDNVDSNDIVDRILDTEIQIETKESENSPKIISETTKDLNTAEVIETNNVIEIKEIIPETSENDKKPEAIEDNECSKKEANNVTLEMESGKSRTTNRVQSVAVVQETESKTEQENALQETVTESNLADDNKSTKDISSLEEKPLKENLEEKSETVKEIEETKKDENIATPTEQTSVDTAPANTKEDEKVKEDQIPKESTIEDSQLNGEATNGEKESVNQNGDACKDEELSSRLSVENGKEVNGSNGDSMDVENEAAKEVEADVSDIKVKSVTTEEPHTERIEQPTEA